MKYSKNIIINSTIFLSIYYILFISGLIKFFAPGSSQIFGDYQIFFNAINCVNLNLSPYNGPSELNCNGFNYGHAILFFTPFKNFIINNNQIIFPVILIFIFVIITSNFFNQNNFLTIFLSILVFLNPSTLLLLERMNLDIILYLIIIFLSYNKFSFLNWLLVIYSFLIKFHPFIFGIIIFIEKKNRSIKYLLSIFLFILISSIIFILFFLDEYKIIFDNSGNWKMGLHLLFSIKTIPKVLKEAFSFHYGLSLLIFYILFFFIIKKNLLNCNFDLSKNFNFEEKLFILSANSLLFCFLTFSNAFYREVFIILLIPYILKNIQSYNFKLLIKILIIKLIFNFIYIIFLNFDTFYHLNGIRIYNASFLFISFLKGLIDYVLMIKIGIITLSLNLIIIKTKILSKKF